jgi:hypothetical protein
MREFSHTLTLSKSKRSAILRVAINDQYGNKIINLSSVRGWRRDLAMKYLQFDSKDWSLDSARAYIGLEVLKVARDKYEGIRLINIVKSLNSFEVHFWASCYQIIMLGEHLRSYTSILESIPRYSLSLLALAILLYLHLILHRISSY